MNKQEFNSEFKRRLGAFEIILLVSGLPIWLSLLICVAAVVFSIYVSIWVLIISLWSVFGAAAATSFGSVFSGVVFLVRGSSLTGIFMLGAGFFLAGLSIFIFIGCKAATRGAFLLTKRIALWGKKLFSGREKNSEETN